MSLLSALLGWGRPQPEVHGPDPSSNDNSGNGNSRSISDDGQDNRSISSDPPDIGEPLSWNSHPRQNRRQNTYGGLSDGTDASGGGGYGADSDGPEFGRYNRPRNQRQDYESSDQDGYGGQRDGYAAGRGRRPRTMDTPDPLVLPPMCVICKTKPPHSDAMRTYPTCGKTCRDILKNRCEVCFEKPKNGNYPTCGNRCAAKLKEIQNLCIQCMVKPKVNGVDSGGAPYRFCGRTCRDQARYGAPLPVSANPRASTFEAKKAKALSQAPSLLEIPQRQALYDKVLDTLSPVQGRGGQRLRPPTVVGIFKVFQNEHVVATLENYSTMMRNKKTSGRWIRVTQMCQMRASGITKPCDEYGCSLCDILTRNNFGRGAVKLSGRSDRAHSLPTGSRQAGGVKVLVFVKVVTSRSTPEMSETQAYARQGTARNPPDVVQLVDDDPNRPSDQLLVFNTDAISPKYVVLCH